MSCMSLWMWCICTTISNLVHEHWGTSIEPGPEVQGETSIRYSFFFPNNELIHFKNNKKLKISRWPLARSWYNSRQHKSWNSLGLPKLQQRKIIADQAYHILIKNNSKEISIFFLREKSWLGMQYISHASYLSHHHLNNHLKMSISKS